MTVSQLIIFPTAADFTDIADKSAFAVQLTALHGSYPIDKTFLNAVDFTDFVDMININTNTSLFYCNYLIS